MNCFPCFSSKSKKSVSRKEFGSDDFNDRVPPGDEEPIVNENIAAKVFTFRELASATRNFKQDCLLGEGGFGRVYKGTFKDTNQVVAVKQLDRNGQHGNRDFISLVSVLSDLHHPNLVNLIGYCADGDQRLLVYEYVSSGSVEDHLLDIKGDQKPLDWTSRMKVAYGASQGLEYLHDKANPPFVYKDLKASNILLDEEFNPKLSDFGLGKLGPAGDSMPLTTGVMGTYGYSAPELIGGPPTLKSDVFSFGVVLLELITGRRAVDTTKSVEEQNLVAWAQPMFRDPKRFPDMADPLLKKEFPERGLNQAVAIAAMCLQEEPSARPLISDVVTALSFLSMATESIPTAIPIMSTKHAEFIASISRVVSRAKSSSSSDEECSDQDDDNEHHDGETASSSDDEDDSHYGEAKNVSSRRKGDGSSSDEEEETGLIRKKGSESRKRGGASLSHKRSKNSGSSHSQKSSKNLFHSSRQSSDKSHEDPEHEDGEEDEESSSSDDSSSDGSCEEESEEEEDDEVEKKGNASPCARLQSRKSRAKSTKLHRKSTKKSAYGSFARNESDMSVS